MVDRYMFRIEKCLDAFKSALEERGYDYIEPLNKSGGWAEIFIIYFKHNKELRVAKIYKEPIGRINEYKTPKCCKSI